MRPYDRWLTWLRTAEATGNTGSLMLAELALLDVHGVALRNVGEVEWRVCLDRRTPDELAAEYAKRCGLTMKESTT